MTATSELRPSPLLRHFDYTEIENCDCEVCADWRRKRDLYQAAAALVAGHGRSCTCAGCKSMRSVRTAYHAADERRNLYSEMSFHAGLGDLADGELKMMWLKDEIMSGRRSDGWWEGRAPYYPMGHWFLQAKKGVAAFASTVSGSLSAVVTGSVGLVAAVTGMNGHGFAFAGASGTNDFYSRLGEIAMKSPALDAARAEEKQIVGELERHPLYKRLQTLRQFISEYGATFANAVTPKPAMAVNGAAARSTAKVPGEASSREVLLNAAESFLKEKGGAALAKEMVPWMEAKGLTLGNGGARLLANYMIKAKGRFVYAKPHGFGLPPSSKPTPSTEHEQPHGLNAS